MSLPTEIANLHQMQQPAQPIGQPLENNVPITLGSLPQTNFEFGILGSDEVNVLNGNQVPVVKDGHAQPLPHPQFVQPQNQAQGFTQPVNQPTHFGYSNQPHQGQQPPPFYPSNQPHPFYPSNQPPPQFYPSNQPPPQFYPGNQPPPQFYPGNQPPSQFYPGTQSPQFGGNQPYGHPVPQPPHFAQPGYQSQYHHHGCQCPQCYRSASHYQGPQSYQPPVYFTDSDPQQTSVLTLLKNHPTESLLVVPSPNNKETSNELGIWKEMVNLSTNEQCWKSIHSNVLVYHQPSSPSCPAGQSVFVNSWTGEPFKDSKAISKILKDNQQKIATLPSNASRNGLIEYGAIPSQSDENKTKTTSASTSSKTPTDSHRAKPSTTEPSSVSKKKRVHEDSDGEPQEALPKQKTPKKSATTKKKPAAKTQPVVTAGTNSIVSKFIDVANEHKISEFLTKNKATAYLVELRDIISKSKTPIMYYRQGYDGDTTTDVELCGIDDHGVPIVKLLGKFYGTGHKRSFVTSKLGTVIMKHAGKDEVKGTTRYSSFFIRGVGVKASERCSMQHNFSYQLRISLKDEVQEEEEPEEEEDEKQPKRKSKAKKTEKIVEDEEEDDDANNSEKEAEAKTTKTKVAKSKSSGKKQVDVDMDDDVDRMMSDALDD